MNVIEELYYGKLNPSQKIFEKNSEYGKSLVITTELESAITKLLTESEKPLLTSLMSASADICSITAAEYFAIGFRLGAKIGLEILSDHNGCLQDIT